MEDTVRHSQFTLSGKNVCAQASGILMSALASVGWLVGAGSVDPMLLVEVLVRAGAERRSMNAIARLAENLPGAETIRKAILALLPKSVEQLEPVVAHALHKKLPKGLKRRPRTMAIDMHNKPFYGAKNTPGVYRGQPKASTKNFFAYATLLVVRKGQTFTVGLKSIVNAEELGGIIDQLLRQAAAAGLRPRRLLLDRGFYAAKVMLALQERNLPFVMPMIRRGKKGKTQKECTATQQFFVKGRTGWARYTWQARPRNAGRQGPRTNVTTEVCMAPRNAKDKKEAPLVFACHGMSHWAPGEIAELYRQRFRIETSYRQMREGLAMTSSKNRVYRLLLVLIALVLRNLWVWLHWTRIAGRDENGRRVLRLSLLRARTMLHCLNRYLDRKLGIGQKVHIPNPAATAA
jgi:putative transposase